MGISRHDRGFGVKSAKKKPKAPSKATVAIVMGSDSDLPIMKAAGDALREFGVGFKMEIISAHRTPAEVATFAKSARKKGIRVIIAGAGGAAHLPGMIAAHTELPVVGVPVPIGHLQGQDALLSIGQMPRGVPVATVAIGNAWNAAVLAAQILGVGTPAILDRLAEYKQGLREELRRKNKRLVGG